MASIRLCNSLAIECQRPSSSASFSLDVVSRVTSVSSCWLVAFAASTCSQQTRSLATRWNESAQSLCDSIALVPPESKASLKINGKCPVPLYPLGRSKDALQVGNFHVRWMCRDHTYLRPQHMQRSCLSSKRRRYQGEPKCRRCQFIALPTVFPSCSLVCREKVKAAKATSQQLETEVARLTTSNEKLADDEGRWHSIARELQSRMEAFRKVSALVTTAFASVQRTSRLECHPSAGFVPFSP